MNPDSVILDIFVRLNAELIALREQKAKYEQRIRELEAEKFAPPRASEANA